MTRAFFFLVSLILFSAQIASAGITWGYSGRPVRVSTSDRDYVLYLRYMRVPLDKQNGAVWNSGNAVTTTTPSDADVHAIATNIKTLETNLVQQEIVDKMMASKDNFVIRDGAHGLARVLQRLNAVQKMKDFNVNGKYKYYSEEDNPAKRQGYTTATHWKLRQDADPDARVRFRQDSGTSYEAIEQLCVNSNTWGECLGAAMACVWWGTASALDQAQTFSGRGQPGQAVGKAAFNAWFDPTPMKMRTYDPSIEKCIADPRRANPPSGDLITVENGQPVDPHLQTMSILVPGDLGNWKNANYEEIMHARIQANGRVFNPFYEETYGTEGNKVKLLDSNTAYLAQGENAFYAGKDSAGVEHYDGLGGLAVNATADSIRNSLMDLYNQDMANVINKAAQAGGTLYGVSNIEEITPRNRNAKIKFVEVVRPKL